MNIKIKRLEVMPCNVRATMNVKTYTLTFQITALSHSIVLSMSNLVVDSHHD